MKKFFRRIFSPTSPAGSFYAITVVVVPIFIMLIYSFIRIYNFLEGGRIIMLGAIFVYLTFVAGILLAFVTLVSGRYPALGVFGIILSVVAMVGIAYVGYVVFKSDILMALSLWGGFPAIALWILRLELFIDNRDKGICDEDDDYDDEDDYYDDDDGDDDYDAGWWLDNYNDHHDHDDSACKSYGEIDPETKEKIEGMRDIIRIGRS